MASSIGLFAGIALARSEGVAESEQLRVALPMYVLGLTPIAVLVTQAVARTAVPPPPPPLTSPPGGGIVP